MSLLSSLTNRIFLGSALLVSVAIGVAVSLVNRAYTTKAEDDLRVEVTEAAALVTDTIGVRRAQFLTEAKLVADLPLLTNAIASNDPPTIEGAATVEGGDVMGRIPD